jgi:hypothetical protein
MTEEGSNNALVVTTTVPGFMTCAEIVSKLRIKYHGKTYDVTTPAGMKEAIDARAELRAIRITLDKEKPKVKEDARNSLIQSRRSTRLFGARLSSTRTFRTLLSMRKKRGKRPQRRPSARGKRTAAPSSLTT